MHSGNGAKAEDEAGLRRWRAKLQLLCAVLTFSFFALTSEIDQLELGWSQRVGGSQGGSGGGD